MYFEVDLTKSNTYKIEVNDQKQTIRIHLEYKDLNVSIFFDRAIMRKINRELNKVKL